MLRATLKATLLIAAMLVPGVASAATAAIVTTDLNIRTGPGASYQRFGTIPAGYRVTVLGCLTGYNWCDVDWAGTRGWVSGTYLAYREGGNYYDRSIASVGISIGVPVIGFDAYSYHDRYYRGRSWYRDRYLDRRDDRHDWRDARRHDNRDWRDGRRDDRRDWREGRREDNRDWRDGRRGDRNDARDGRRDDRRETRNDRRDDRGDKRVRREQFDANGNRTNADPNRNPEAWRRLQHQQRDQR